MAQDNPNGTKHELPSREEEARNLATEAVQEMKHGNKDEGEFLLSEAKNLDPEAAKDVLKKEGGKL